MQSAITADIFSMFAVRVSVIRWRYWTTLKVPPKSNVNDLIKKPLVVHSSFRNRFVNTNAPGWNFKVQMQFHARGLKLLAGRNLPNRDSGLFQSATEVNGRGPISMIEEENQTPLGSLHLSKLDGCCGVKLRLG